MASILNDPNRAAAIEIMADSILQSAVPAAQPKRNLFVAGLSAGIDQTQALAGRGIQAVGDAVGSQTVSDFGAGIAERNFAEAAKNGRPDLETRPTLENWTDYPAWAAYQAMKNVPTMAAAIAAYKLGGSRLAGRVSGDLAEVGASVPKIMGGGGLRAGATLAEQQAARQAGAQWVAGMASQAPVMYPQAVGSMYDEALQAGEGGQGNAVKALAMGVPYSLMEGFEPGALSSIVSKGLGGNFLKRLGTGAAVGAATEVVTEGVQTGMEQTFRPDLTAREKMSNVIEGAIAGGVVGGLFGGGAGVLGGNSHVKTAPPSQVTKDDLKKTVDNALKPSIVGVDASRSNMGEAETLPDVRGNQVPNLRQQTNIAEVGDQGVARPFEHVNEAELLARLNIVQQREMDARQGLAQSNPRAALLIQQLNHELDIRQGRTDAVEPPVANTGQRQYPEGSVGTGQWKRYEDVGGPPGAEIAQARLAQMEDVQADTSLNNAPTTDGMDLFKAASIPLDEQLSPAEIARRSALQETVGYSEEEKAARIAKVDEFYGKTTARWQERAKAAPWKDDIDLAKNVIAEVTLHDAQNIALPKSLVKAAEKIGLTKADGAPRDLEAEYQAAAQENSARIARSRATGLAQDQAAAEKYTKETFAPLKLKVEALRAAKKRLAAESAAAPVTAPATPAVAPGANQMLGINPGTRTAAEAAETLEFVPPPPVAPSFDQRFRQRGVAPTTGPTEIEPSAPVAAPVAPSKPADMSAVQDRWASGKVAQTQAERMAAREAAARAPAGPVAPSIPAAPLAGGSAISPSAATAAPAEQPPQVYTAQDAAKARLEANRKRRQRRNAPPAVEPVIPAAPLAGGTVTRAEAPAQQTPAGVSLDTLYNVDARAQNLQQLSQIAASEKVGRPMRQAASEAYAALESMQPGGEAMAAKVLSEHAAVEKVLAREAAGEKIKKGGIVFSRRDANNPGAPLSDEAFTQAMQAATRNMPVSAMNAINVVNTVEDLPIDALAAAEIMGIHPSGIRGVLHNDTVYIVKNHISSQAELEDVIAHEVFGHGGARALFGDRRVSVLSTAFKMAGGLRGVQSIAKQFGVQNQLDKYIYIPVRHLTDQDEANIVDELLAQVAGKTTGKFRTALLSWVGTFKGALIRALRAIGLNRLAERLDVFDAATLAAMLTQMRYAVQMGGNLGGGDTSFSAVQVPNTPDGMNESTKNLATSAANVEKWFHSRDFSELSLKANQFNLYTSSVGHIVDTFAPLFDVKDADGNITNPLRDWKRSNEIRGVAEQRIAHLVQVGYRQFERVAKGDPKGAEKIGMLMNYTAYNIDPAKTWDEHGWLHAKANASEAETAHANAMKKHVTEANRIYRDIRQNHVAAAATYDAFVNTNEALHFAQQAVSLYNMLMMDAAVPETVKAGLRDKNPMQEFLDKTVIDDPKAARDFWDKKSAELVETTTEFVKAQRGMSSLSDEAARKKINVSVSSLDARLRTIDQERLAMKQSPYFHLGRFGDYVVSFHIKRDAQGNADPAAMDRIVDAFKAAGIEGIEIPVNGTRANAFMRFENLTQAKEARRVAKMLAQEGVVLDELVGEEDSTTDRRIKMFSKEGERSAMAFELTQSPRWAQDLMDNIKHASFGGTGKLSKDEQKIASAVRSEMERHIQQYFVNLLPDTAVNKVMVHRNNVPGYSSDMIRSYLFRTQVGGRALANLYAAAPMAQARRGLIGVANEARVEDDTKNAMIKQNVVNEVFKRDAQRPLIIRNNFIDTWRAVNHAYFLGMSPAYVAVNMTQVGVLLWPELSKRFGFINSAKAIGKVTPMAMKIMTAVVKEGAKIGFNNIADASISREVLNKIPGITPAQIEFVMRMVNSGVIDIGSQSRELGRVVEGTASNTTENALRWAAAAGYYSEMVSRLVAALAARELHGGTSPEMYEYASETVRQSMFQYETWNQARATGRMGMAGQFTPVMTSFLQYTFQLTEKLYREFTRAFMKAAKTDAERTQARKFVAAHLAAVTMLTGTLGMPMASVFAKVFDTMADVFGDDDDEPSDIRASYRNWLALNLGKDLGEIVSRGMPRAIGIDVSQRAGEQDILPFGHMVSKLITDRGKWQDRVEQWALQTLGSPVSMVSSIISGGDKLMAGDIKGAMLDAFPTALKNPVKAYYLTQQGYVDGKGNKLPMEASEWDVLNQAMGFTPARRAEYAEERGVQASLKGNMYRKSQIVRNQLAQAVESGDGDAMAEALAIAQRFDERNPEFQVLPTFNSVLRSRARERMKADMQSAPFGTKPGLADRTAFGNFD